MPRTTNKVASKFKTALSTALKNVNSSLTLFAGDSGKRVENVVISSNVTLGVERPADPGVAVWFVWDGMQVCIAVDRYPKVQDNLQAIHHIVEARRTEMRHGGLHIVRATFRGFTCAAGAHAGEKDVARGSGLRARAAPKQIVDHRRLPPGGEEGAPGRRRIERPDGGLERRPRRSPQRDSV
ncbi:J domain-containing protein [Mesorhizobium atlanticum]